MSRLSALGSRLSADLRCAHHAVSTLQNSVFFIVCGGHDGGSVGQ